jgi:hypothetical protein
VVVAGGGAVVVVVVAPAVAVGLGAVVVGAGAVAVGFGAAVGVVGAAVAVGVGEGVGVVVTPLLSILKSPRRLEVVPFDDLSTTLMVCDPSASFMVSYGSAVPSAAVPAKSKGGFVSVRTNRFVRLELSR